MAAPPVVRRLRKATTYRVASFKITAGRTKSSRSETLGSHAWLSSSTQ